MNYVQHTRAAHERLLAQPEARPHHVSLYWALFFEWNTARFPKALPLRRDELMAAARIGNRNTYLTTLRELEAFGLLRYEPRHNATGSTAQLVQFSGPVVAEVVQPEGVGCSRSGTTETGQVVAQVVQPVVAEVIQPSPEVVAEVVQHSLLSKTLLINSVVNGGAGTEKKIGEVFGGEGLSEAQVFDDNPTPPTGAGPPPGAAPQKKVAPKKRGVGSQAETIRAAASAQAEGVGPAPRRPAPLPELPFSQSAIADPAAFAAAFQGSDYELADLRHYHQLVATWRDKKTGHPPLRKDWVATAKRFMLNDAADNRLKLAPGTTPASHADAGQPAATGIPASGYRSSRWD